MRDGLRELRRISDILPKALGYLDLPCEIGIRVEDSLGWYSAETVISSFKLPPKPKAVMDGYAVRVDDVEAASPVSPIPLKLLDASLRPGFDVDVVLKPGFAARVETGSLLPIGADAVVPIEDVVEGDGMIFVSKRLARYENVSLPGEEYDEGVAIVRRGCRITPQSIAGLILEGRGEVRVFDLRARILNVGDELVGSSYFKPFTHMFIASWLRWHGFTVDEISMMKDDIDEIASWLQRGGKPYLSILVGGTSMGRYDYTIKAMERINPEYMVHGFAIQPGKTACLAVKDSKPILALSGLPVAAMSTLEYLLKPLIRGLGLDIPVYPKVKAILTRRVTVKLGVKGFVRVRVYRSSGRLYAEPLMTGGSGALASLLRGNGFVEVPEDIEGFDEGCEVEVNLYGSVSQLD
ncbi:MAG: molybdopterin molybdotransferase MoeA [Candidatus Bathyarchaeota archaeon]|nr:molybdopterin molybdotransferase MoeA [Candidatus Bathyarchaeota archaeon]